MNDQSMFGYPDTGARPESPGSPVLPEDPAQPPPGSPFQGSYKFSPEELQVMAVCNRESFYQRSLPLSTVLGFGTYAALQKGYLKPNPRFGVIPKMSLAVIVGYFIGKLSYQQACAEKLMALPGSYIGQLLRERRDGRTGPSPKQPPTMFGAGPNDIYSDAGPGSSLDLDTDRPIFSGDDSYRENDGGGAVPSDPEKKRPSLSYDDLRRKNRGEYSDIRQDPYRMDPSALPPISRARQPAQGPPPAPAPGTNKYGDIID